LEITLNGTRYSSPLSEGLQCDAFDGATDDAIAFLNLIQQTENKADVNRTSMRGGSRGGTVALLAGIRDKRIKKVVGIVSPTNFVKLTALNENDPTYRCQFLSILKSNPSFLVQTRTKLIASSPVYFAQHLPATQLHMGLNDKNVPIDQGYELEQKINQLGMSSNFQLFTYDKTHTDIATNNSEMTNRIEQFLSQL
jgi:dipeptidyl aminopeptidase/acylaminoacyl peptidase